MGHGWVSFLRPTANEQGELWLILNFELIIIFTLAFIRMHVYAFLHLRRIGASDVQKCGVRGPMPPVPCVPRLGQRATGQQKTNACAISGRRRVGRKTPCVRVDAQRSAHCRERALHTVLTVADFAAGPNRYGPFRRIEAQAIAVHQAVCMAHVAPQCHRKNTARRAVATAPVLHRAGNPEVSAPIWHARQLR